MKSGKRILMLLLMFAMLLPLLGCDAEVTEPAITNDAATGTQFTTQESDEEDKSDKPDATVEGEEELIASEDAWKGNVMMRMPIHQLTSRLEDVRTVRFMDNLEDAPADAVDLSENGDGSVLGWMIGTDVYIAGNGGINGENAQGLFYCLSELEVIAFGEAFHTEYTWSMADMFAGCASLKEVDVENLNTSSVYSMANMFSMSVPGDDGQFSLKPSVLTKLDVSGWDTSKVGEMSCMFYGCDQLTELDVSNWNTSNVESMYYMFAGCGKLVELDVSEWDTSAVIFSRGMFCECYSLERLDVSNWNVEEFRFTDDMFRDCRSLRFLDVSKWNTQSIAEAQRMFLDCPAQHTVDLSGWDLSIYMHGDFMNPGTLVNGVPWEELFG